MRIDDLIRQLRAISESEGKQKLEDNPELLRLIEGIGIKVDAKNPGRIKDLIERIEHLRATSEADVLERKLADAMTSAEEDLENARVPTATIKALVEEYERHLEEGLTHEQAVERVVQNNRDLVAKRNVETFLDRQQKIYEETVKKLGPEAKQEAKIIATERLVTEERLATVEEDGSLTKEEKKQYSQEVVAQGEEITRARVEVDKKVEKITEKLIADFEIISPDEFERNKPELERLIKEKITEQVRGETRIEEGLVDDNKTVRGLTDQIAEVLELPPSEKTIVEETVAKIEVQIAEQSQERIKIVTETIVTELAKKPDIAAAVEANKVEIARVVSEERDFKVLAEKITTILGVPEAGAPLITEAVAVAETKSNEWNAVETEQAVNRLITELRTDPETAAVTRVKEKELRPLIRLEVERVVNGEIIRKETIQETVSRENLVQKIVNDLRVPPEKVPQVNLTIRNASLSVDQLIQSNKNEVAVVRAEYIRNKIEQGFVETNGKLTQKQTIKVQKYARFVSEFYTNSNANLEPYKKEATAFAENRGKTPGVVKNAWNEVTGISKIVQMPPKQFRAFQEKYFQLKDGLGGLKMPFGVPQSRSLEGLMKLTQEVPGVKNLLSLTQKFTNFSASVSNFTGGILQRIGLQKIGIGVVEKIGGQAMGVFVKHSLAVIAEQGAQKGLMMIMHGILGGGVHAGVAGTAAAGAGAAGASGALAGAVAAFQAIPVVGQIVLVGAMAILAVTKIVKPIFDKVKKFFAGFTNALGIDLSGLQLVSKRFLKEKFGKVIGGAMGFLSDVGTGIVMAPMILIGGISLAFIGPFIAIIFIGLLVTSLDLDSKASSLVPRAQPPVGVEVYDYGGDPGEPFIPGPPLPTRDPKRKIDRNCPEIWPTNSGVITQGPLGKWSHRKAQAIDIGVGSVPIVATHNGWAMVGGSKDGLYGYYVDVIGTCKWIDIRTRYAHMPNWLFLFPKFVFQGDLIGYVDNTGNSTGSHLHYELYGGQINDWLPKGVPLRCSNVDECNVSIP